MGDIAYQNKEELQMTKVEQLIYADGWEKGIEKGIERGTEALIRVCREFHMDREDAGRRVSAAFGISEEKSGAYIDKYWKQAREFLTMLRKSYILLSQNEDRREWKCRCRFLSRWRKL